MTVYRATPITALSVLLCMCVQMFITFLSEHNYCTFTLGVLHESHLDMVVNELTTISRKWEILGQQLQIPIRILGDIRTQYSDPADGMKELIKVWLKKKYRSFIGLTTWGHVVAALKSPMLGESQLGECLKQKYLPGELFDTFTIACYGSTIFR